VGNDGRRPHAVVMPGKKGKQMNIVKSTTIKKIRSVKGVRCG
jgi:hypothetical protein